MKQILSARELMLTKSLGQNFLHDQNQLRRIVAAAELSPSDKVLEIGPGLGPLTELLVAAAGKVLAIEKDRRLYEFLCEKFAGASNLELVCGDALRHVETQRDWAGWKLVANLPYSVASPILVELAQSTAPPDRLVTTLQLEVANRIGAAAGKKEYGVLSLLVQLRYEMVSLFKIPGTCFFPSPDVDSACVTLLLRPQPLLPFAKQATFAKIVKRGFSQRRKMLMKLLKQDWTPNVLEAAFIEIGISFQIRGEALDLPTWVALTNALAK